MAASGPAHSSYILCGVWPLPRDAAGAPSHRRLRASLVAWLVLPPSLTNAEWSALHGLTGARRRHVQTFGCGSVIASSSFTTEWVKGKGLDEVGTIKNSDIAAELKLPPVKLHCSMLAEDAIKAAIKDYQAKQSDKDQAANVDQAASA